VQAGDAIHTYRLRQGRTSRTALAELERLQPRFGCAPTDLLDPLRVFGRLAPLVVAELYELVGSLAAEGIAILLVEQFAHTALAVADHAVILAQGKVTRTGTPDDVREHLSAAYLGGAA